MIWTNCKRSVQNCIQQHIKLYRGSLRKASVSYITNIFAFKFLYVIKRKWCPKKSFLDICKGYFSASEHWIFKFLLSTPTLFDTLKLTSIAIEFIFDHFQCETWGNEFAVHRNLVKHIRWEHQENSSALCLRARLENYGVFC